MAGRRAADVGVSRHRLFTRQRLRQRLGSIKSCAPRAWSFGKRGAFLYPDRIRTLYVHGRIGCGGGRNQCGGGPAIGTRSEEHTSELQSLMRISYAVFCLKKNTTSNKETKAAKIKNSIHRPTHQY